MSMKPMKFWAAAFFAGICATGTLRAAELTEEEAYAQRWTRADFEETLAESRQWLNNDIGKGEYAPPPWTPMEVKGQEIACWGRTYKYADSVLPVQIVSLGRELLAGRPVFVLASDDGERHVFDKASVVIEKAHDGLVNVVTVSRSGLYTLTLTAGYEFDGMGKFALTLEGAEGAAPVDGFHLEISLKAGHSILYHCSGGRFGLNFNGELLHPARPPMSDAGFVPKDGTPFDFFREVIWCGDQNVGLTWFADGMQGWRIKDETGVQIIGPESAGARKFSVKFADGKYESDNPMKLTFGMQATPMRLRPANFRSLDKADRRWGDERNIEWLWSWSEGHYYPSQEDYSEEAKRFIQDCRKKGRELMQASSVHYYGVTKFYENNFGVLKNPGMILREILLWGELWENSTREIGFGDYAKADMNVESVEDIQKLKEAAINMRNNGMAGGKTIDAAMKMEHTVARAVVGEWFGKKFKPSPYPPSRCPASSFKDYYIWQLQKFIKQTGVGAYYFDQGFRTCNNAGHGCGYIDSQGKWVGASPIFEMRELLKRIYFTFYELNGFPPLIKWHQSSQMALPVMSFIDIHWNGELYTGGMAARDRNLAGGRYYSEILDEGVMQVFHMGKQFGFLASLLPNITHSRPRDSSSERDMTGLMMIHDSHVEGYNDFANIPDLVHEILRKRLSYPLAEMQTIYYWAENSGVDVSPARVKYIMHYNDEQALLILFNWSGGMALPADVRIDAKLLNVQTEQAIVTDVMSGHEVHRGGLRFAVDVLPRDFRMLEIKWRN